MRYANDYGMNRGDYGMNRGGYGMGRSDYGMNRSDFEMSRGRGTTGDYDRGSASMGQGGGFRGRGQEYGSYTRRDFLTNQGDFSDDFGGGPEYGYSGMERGLNRGRGFEEMRGQGLDYGTGREYGRMNQRGGMSRGGSESWGGGMSQGGMRGTNRGGFSEMERGGMRGMNRGGMRESGGMDDWSFGGSRDRTSYGPGYGDRWETTDAYDMAYRNFGRY